MESGISASFVVLCNYFKASKKYLAVMSVKVPVKIWVAQDNMFDLAVGHRIAGTFKFNMSVSRDGTYVKWWV
jgi:hypothetical protein